MIKHDGVANNKQMGKQISSFRHVKVEGYKVEVKESGRLMATETNYVEPIMKSHYSASFEYTNCFDFESYINSLYQKIVDQSSYSSYTPGIVSFDGSYLIVVENGYTITKKVFDLREIELNPNIRSQIDELHHYLLLNNKESFNSKYVPVVSAVVGRKVSSLLKPEDMEEFVDFYEKASGYAYSKRYPRPSGSVWPACFLYIFGIDRIPAIKSFSHNHFYLWVACYFTYLVLGLMGDKKLRVMLSHHIVDNEINEYIDCCNRLNNGDLDTIRFMSAEISRVATELDFVNDNSFYLNLSRDMTVLDCFDDKALIPIRLELLSLGSEYIQYRSSMFDNNFERAIGLKNEVVEELFLNKLKTIEEKIDLTKYSTNNTIDRDVQSILSTNCEFDSNNCLRLVPVEFDEELLSRSLS